VLLRNKRLTTTNVYSRFGKRLNQSVYLGVESRPVLTDR
jgi:hypothetical protein